MSTDAPLFDGDISVKPSTKDDGFDLFWKRYPRRVGKLAAERAFRIALKRATVDEIMTGLARYIETKPAYADWCHPRTFLTQGRWMDDVEQQVVQSGPPATRDELYRIGCLQKNCFGRLLEYCRHDPMCADEPDHIRALINGWRGALGTGPLPPRIDR